jgi:hypothetical protein
MLPRAVAFLGGTYSLALALICLLFIVAAALALLAARYFTSEIKVTDEDIGARASETSSG